ncbi:MAG: prepilin-type N-terminal cleavage/methylation domain-containing protein [Gemmatimonadales bacterium]
MRRARSNRGGFTLVEVMIAIFILGSIVLTMAASASRYLSVATKNRQRVQANAAAEAQIALVRVSPTYDSLTVRFDSTTANMPAQGYTRVTSVVRTGTGTTSDITKVTVTITGPLLATPVKRSISIAAP